ncbi:transposase [Pedobacter agri]|uniref:Transposase n=1 Tax=Pedobacter agri TaxID=454586 RepID=A0A9X3IBD6_9SPHI|nr:transposase [Pedobacter agri]MCX3267310.1 transposase [Pedobacter agri]
MIERGGLLVAKVMKDTSASEIEPIVNNTIKPNSTVRTDEWQVIASNFFKLFSITKLNTNDLYKMK